MKQSWFNKYEKISSFLSKNAKFKHREFKVIYSYCDEMTLRVSVRKGIHQTIKLSSLVEKYADS